MEKLSQTYKAEARPFLNLVDDLRKIGVHKNIPIPQIAVMGDQSSGKSSVLESISGIQFPRGPGLCTRCPTQVTMSEGNVWSAQIVLWTGLKEQVVRTLSEDEKREVHAMIEKMTTVIAGDKAQKGFSKIDTYIEIKLTSPGAPDLTIIDLPGIIRTPTAGQSKAVKTQVTEMLNHYLKQERTVILAVIPANVDIATVEILEMASKVDPQGKRTIGVLTKPDLVDEGGEAGVIEVLANRAKPLLHGYFMVKNRSQKALDDAESVNHLKPLLLPGIFSRNVRISCEQDMEKQSDCPRKEESAWLARSKYANVPEVGSTRLGVEALTVALTCLLVKLISAVLPDLKQEVNAKLEETTEELKSLGKCPPSSTQACLLASADTINEYYRLMLGTVSEGNPIAEGTAAETEGILQIENRARRIFALKVQETKPYLDEAQCTLQVMKCTKKSQAYARKLKPGCVYENMDCQPWYEVGSEVNYSGPGGGQYVAKILNVSHSERERISIRMDERRGRELPVFLSFPVFTSFMEEYVLRWEKPTQVFHSKLREGFERASSHFISLLCAKWPGLGVRMKAEIQQHLKEVEARTADRLKKLLALEKRPSTENHYLCDTINKIRNERMAKRIASIAMPVPQLGADKTAYVPVETVCSMLRSDVGNCSNESQAVQDMLDFLSAYWKVAKKRYVDDAINILRDAYTSPEHIKKVKERLLEALVLLDLGGSQVADLFVEPPERRRRREKLRQVESVMRKAQARLQQGVC